MTRRSEIKALLAKIEALAQLAEKLHNPVIDMLIAKAKGELAQLLANAVD